MGGTDRVRVDQLGGERGDRKDEARGEERNNNNQTSERGYPTHTYMSGQTHTTYFVVHTKIPGTHVRAIM